MLETTLRELLKASPHSRPLLINVCDASMGKEQIYTVKTSVKEFSIEYKYTYYVEIPKGVLKNLGCIGHPNVKGQRLIAETLYPQVKKIMDNPEEPSILDEWFNIHMNIYHFTTETHDSIDAEHLEHLSD